MTPNMDNGGRWHHIASERETMKAVRDRGSRIVEAAMIGITFILSDSFLTIVRSGAMGGDVRTIEGGWVYADFISYNRDVEEIKAIGRATGI